MEFKKYLNRTGGIVKVMRDTGSTWCIANPSAYAWQRYRTAEVAQAALDKRAKQHGWEEARS